MAVVSLISHKIHSVRIQQTVWPNHLLVSFSLEISGGKCFKDAKICKPNVNNFTEDILKNKSKLS